MKRNNFVKNLTKLWKNSTEVYVKFVWNEW